MERLNEKIRTECPLLGKRVVIKGTNRKALNGKTGVVAFFDSPRRRYVVALDEQGGKEVTVKAKHLRPA